MGIGLTPDHVELATAVRRWAAARQLTSATRRALDAEHDELPSCWAELAELGWLGLGVSSEHGGQGYGVAELVVVLEELGRACAPGPFLATAVAALAIDRWAPDGSLVADLLGGAGSGGFAPEADLSLEPDPDGGRVTGVARAVWGGALADRFVLPVATSSTGGGPGGAPGVVRGRPRPGGGARAAQLRRQQPAGRGAPRRGAGGAERWLDGPAADPGSAPGSCGGGPDPVRLAEVLSGAMAVGVADWCVATAAAYAQERVQFGRPIGQFQAVKHRCADMLVALEAARAAVWDAARAFDEPRSRSADQRADQADEAGWDVARARRPSLGVEAGFRCAKDCIQVLGASATRGSTTPTCT